MYAIEVRAAEEYTLIFTVTAREREPWGRDNATILVAPAQLDALIAHLEARRDELRQLAAARPPVAVGAAVRIARSFRTGQDGRVVAVEEKGERLQQRSGTRWSVAVAFADGTTWTYSVDEVASLP